MTTFALDVNSSEGDIIAGLNYALANLGNNVGTIQSNVLTANVTNGQITTTNSNSSGYTTTTIVSYLYQYMDVKYANSATGSSGFSGNSANKSYYGLRNTANTSISSNPADYSWNRVSGGFGTTKSLFYQTIGGRQIAFYAGNAAPQSDFVSVQDDTPINLDTVTSAQNNQIITVAAYFQSNLAPATPSGGTYNFSTYTLTPPTGWTASIPSFAANTNVYISQATFTGNATSTVSPATAWTLPSIFSTSFQGNTGPSGQRGFVPLGYVVCASDPTSFTNTDFTNAFQASRANSVPPIGLGYAPIAGDTAQFFYQNPTNPNLDVTIVRSFDGAVWSAVSAQVVSGGLIVPGSLTANTLNANQVYALTIQSTNATVGDNNSNGYWFQANTGNGRFGGNLNIGNLLKVGTNAQIGGNLNVGNNANIGTNLTIGNNAVIGGNLSVTGLITQGALANAVVTTNSIVDGSVFGVKIANSTITGTNILDATITGGKIAANTIDANNIATNTITANQIAANTITATQIATNTITASQIAAGTITATQIAAGTITATQIAAGTITGDLVAANTIQGSSIVAGSITATQLQANLLTVGNIVSTNGTIEVPTGSGYWLDYTNGNVYFGGNTRIGTNLIVGNNAVIGGFATVGSNVRIGGNLTVGNNAVIGGFTTIGSNVIVGGNARVGTNLTVGNNAVIGGFATIGSNVSIGGNLAVVGLITNGNLQANTVQTTTIVSQAVSTGQGTSSSTVLTTGGTIANAYYPYTYCSQSLTTTIGVAQIFVSGTIYLSILGGMSSSAVNIILWRTGTSGTQLLFSINAQTVNNGVGVIYAIPMNVFDVVDNPGTNTWNIGATWNGTGTNGQFKFLAGTLVLQQLKR